MGQLDSARVELHGRYSPTAMCMGLSALAEQRERKREEKRRMEEGKEEKRRVEGGKEEKPDDYSYTISPAGTDEPEALPVSGAFSIHFQGPIDIHITATYSVCTYHDMGGPSATSARAGCSEYIWVVASLSVACCSTDGHPGWCL